MDTKKQNKELKSLSSTLVECVNPQPLKFQCKETRPKYERIDYEKDIARLIKNPKYDNRIEKKEDPYHYVCYERILHDGYVLNSKSNTNKYFFCLTSCTLFEVSNKVYSNKDSTPFIIGNREAKMIGPNTLTKAHNYKLLKAMFNKGFKTQGSVVNFIKDFATTINFVASNIRMITDGIALVKDHGKDIVLLMAKVARFLVSLIDIVSAINIIDVIKKITFCCFDLALCVFDFKNVKKTFGEWQAQGLETALIAACLPDKASKILQKMSMLSSMKIGDDVGIMFALFRYVSNFVNVVIDLVPFKDSIPPLVIDLLRMVTDFMSFNSYSMVNSMRSYYGKWKQDPRIILDYDFRKNVKDLHKAYQEKKDISDWIRRSPGIKGYIDDFMMLHKVITGYDSSSRIEPTCIVFDGPPGCRKSVIMNKLIGILNRTSYAHNAKGPSEAKDFYDGYNSESIFYMDDVGQKGICQWVNIINFVSPVKTPLDCAAAALKDLKFFSSEILLLTTNRFKGITGLSKSDPITDIRALWRRALVVNFDRVDVDVELGQVTGHVKLEHFNPHTGEWVDGIPRDLDKHAIDSKFDYKEFSEGKEGVYFDVTKAFDESNDFYVWLGSLVELSVDLKRKQNKDNKMNEVELKNTQKRMFRTQGDINVYYQNGKVKFLREDTEIEYEDAKISTTKTMIKDWFKSLLVCIKDTLMTTVGNFVKIFMGVSELKYTDCLTFVTALAVIALVGMILGHIVGKICNCITGASKKRSDKKVDDTFSAQNGIPTVLHERVLKASRNVFDVSVTAGGKTTECIALVSEHYVIFPQHICLEGSAYLDLYNNKSFNAKFLDKIKIEKVFFDNNADVAIWKLPKGFPTPFKSLESLFKPPTEGGRLMLHPKGVLNLDNLGPASLDNNVVYTSRIGEFRNTATPSDIIYNFQNEGLCGSPILTRDGCILGIHVAGEAASGRGVALRWSKQMIEKLRNIITERVGIKLNIDYANKVIEDSGCMKLDVKTFLSTPKKTKLEPTPLYGVFPISRRPANLSSDGPHTIKTETNQARLQVSNIDEDELAFAKKCVDSLVEKFDPITEKEIVLGNDYLSPMNKKSSNGVSEFKNKEECFDYENGQFTPKFKEFYDKFIQILKDPEVSVDYKLLLWHDTLKDELRAEDKVNKPRAFRISPVHIQVLTKQLFGDFVVKQVKQRDYNGVMIGINPFKDWNKFYDKFKNKHVWAGDIGKYDKGMLPQVQMMIAEVLIDKFTGDKDLAAYILHGMPYNISAANDDVYLYTHSMPSGSFLTANLNSLVNRAYTAMWYYRYVVKNGGKPTVMDFMKIMDAVYGDDKLNGMDQKDPRSSYLNAITMKDFFVSIGLNFTRADKSEIVEPFEKLEDVTFLKRSFRYHSKLECIVGPLDVKTLFSGLSYYWSDKDHDQVLQDKINCFQREMYLHEELYEEQVSKLEKACDELDIPFTRIPEWRLIEMYKQGEYAELYNQNYGLLTIPSEMTEN